MAEDKGFQQKLHKLEELIAGMEANFAPASQSVVQEMIRLIMDLHGTGLDRMMEIVSCCGETGSAIFQKFAKDPAIGSLLLLHGLHPDDLETRILRALEKVRPYLRSHGGNVELVNIEQGAVRLRMEGSCHGCPSSSLTLKLAIEDAIYEAAPDIVSLEVEGVVQKPKTYAIREPVASGVWQDVVMESIPQGTLQMMEVDGRPLLFCKLGESLYAYGTKCPSCEQTLQDASLDANQIACKICGRHYDVTHAGKSLDQPELHLDPVPLLIEQGRVKVALPAGI